MKQGLCLSTIDFEQYIESCILVGAWSAENWHWPLPSFQVKETDRPKHKLSPCVIDLTSFRMEGTVVVCRSGQISRPKIVSSRHDQLLPPPLPHLCHPSPSLLLIYSAYEKTESGVYINTPLCTYRCTKGFWTRNSSDRQTTTTPFVGYVVWSMVCMLGNQLYALGFGVL